MPEPMEGSATSGITPAIASQSAAIPATGEAQPQSATDGEVTNKFINDRALAVRGGDGWIKQLANQPVPAGMKIQGTPEGLPYYSVSSSGSNPAIPTGGKVTPQDVNSEVGSTPIEGLRDAYTSIGHKALNVVRDVGRGVISAPSQITGGVLDATNNLFRFADDVVRYGEQNGLPNVYFRLLDKDGKLAPSILSTDEFRKAQAEGKDDVFQVPTTGEPDTVTGQIIRTGTTFLAGRGNIAARAGGGVAGNLLADFASGGLMDPTQPRLSNVINTVAPNFLTEWMSAKPEDEGTLLGRLKSGMEYAGLGVAFEGAKKALLATKSAIGEHAPTFAQLETQLPKPQPKPPVGPSVGAGTEGSAAPFPPRTAAAEPGVQRDFLLLGDPLGPAVHIPDSPTLRDMANRVIAGESGDNPVKINLAYVQGEDSIKDLLARVSSTIPKTGPQSWEESKQLATTLGITPEKLLTNYQGHTLNAAELDAANLITRSGAEQLYGYITKAIDPATSTPENKALAIKAFLTQRALQQYFENARSEAGRTLNILKSVSTNRSDYAQAIDSIVKGAQESDMDTLFAKIASLGAPGEPDTAAKVAAMVGKSFEMQGRDAFLFGWYNILLSNPRTLGKKLASDTANAMWNVASTYAAERLGSGGIPEGETSQLLYGYIGSFKEGVRAGAKALKAGQSQFWQDYERQAHIGKEFSLLGEDMGSSPIGSAEPTKAWQTYLRSALPTSWIGSVDDMATVINYRAYVRSGAFRDGVKQKLSGDALENYVSENTENVPNWLHQYAVANAQRSTFKEPLSGPALTLQHLADGINIPIAHTEFEIPFGKMILPFVKVPANIAKWSYTNSPIAALAPSSAIRTQLAKGGAERDLAIAKMGLGSAVSLSMADLALNNVITGRGPTDPQLQRAWRAAGNEPYSIRVGDRSYGYNMVEPLGLMMGAVSDTFNIMKFAKDDGRENLASSLIFGTGNALLSKTYLMGVGDFFEALNNPERQGDRWAQNLVASLVVPQGVSAAARATDDWVRTHHDLMDTIESRLPYLSQGLPPARTLWGDPIPQKDAYLPFLGSSKWATMISPVPSVPTHVEPIDAWVWDHRMEFPQGPSNKLGISKPGIVQTFSSGQGVSVQVELTPEQHDRLQVLAGNGVKDPATNFGAKDMLNALVGNRAPAVTQEIWNNASDELRAVMVQRIVNEYRAAAKKVLLSEYGDLSDIVTAGWKTRGQQLMKGQQ